MFWETSNKTWINMYFNKMGFQEKGTIETMTGK